MPSGNTLLAYGIAINFFGNYRQEAGAINSLTGRLNSSLLSLQNLIVGGGITAGLYKFSNAILNVAKSMEQNFANLKSTLGSSSKAIETLKWAREKGAKTPFEIQEVNDAVGTMTMTGFNKNDKMREDTFQAVGDFAALRGANFSDMMMRVSKAAFGNWEGLGDLYQVRRETIGQSVRGQMQRTPDKFKGEESSIEKSIQIVEKGKKGTDEYRQAVVKLIGVLGRGGMEARLDTIAGSWSNVNDLMINFKMSMVGYSQEQGTLANAINTTIKDKILKPFMDVHRTVRDGVVVYQSSVEQLGRIGKVVGQILTGVWGMIDSQIGNSTNTIQRWIDNLDRYFSDFQNNVAPIILFIALVKIQVEEFLRGFYNGFTSVFGWFLKAGAVVGMGLAKIAYWLGIGKTPAESLGKLLGIILGTLLGIRAYRMIVNPLMPLRDGAVSALQMLDKLIMKGRVFGGLGRIADGNWSSGMTLIRGGFSRLIPSITGAATASWGFTASLLANPITWIVIAVIALIAWLGYLIYNWDEVGKKMQGVNDTLLVMLSIFSPIIGIPLLLAKHWTTFKSIFTHIWEGIKSYFHGVWLWFRSLLIRLGNWFKEKFDMISNAWNSLMGYFREHLPWLYDVFDAVGKGISAVVDWVKELWDNIVWFFKDIGNWFGDLLGFADDATSKFEDAGKSYEKNMVDKYGTAKEKEDFYKKVAIANQPNSASTTTTTNNNGHTQNFSGAVFNLNPTSDPNSLFKNLQGMQGKQGK